MPTDKEIEAAALAVTEKLFRSASSLDIATAALTAAEQVRASEPHKIAEAIARDTSCAQGEFHQRVKAIIPYLTNSHD